VNTGNNSLSYAANIRNLFARDASRRIPQFRANAQSPLAVNGRPDGA
jgi:hypothetical protein